MDVAVKNERPYLRWKVKGQLDLWYLSITKASLGYPYVASIILLALTVKEIWKFQDFPCTNEFGIKPCYKVSQVQRRLISCANLVGPTSPMQHTKSHGHWPLKKKSFYFIWAWWPSWSFHQEHLCKLYSFTLKSIHMKFDLNWLSGFREDFWKSWWRYGCRRHWYTNSSTVSLWLR